MKNNLHLSFKNLLFTSALLFSSIFFVQAANSILLKSGTVYTQNDFAEKINLAPSIQEIFNGNYYRFLQFETLPNEQQKQAIELSGIRFLGYIPFNTFYVAIPINYNLQLLSAFNPRTLLPIELNSKLSFQLRENDIPGYAKKGGNVDLIVQYFKNINYATASAALVAKGCELLSNREGAQLIIIRTPENNWKNLAQLPFVKFVQPIDDVPVPDDTRGRSLHRSNVINSDYPMGRHYDGSGVSIALADDGFVGPHIDFTGRITQFTNDPTGSHGDMTSGIAVGAGNLDPSIKGMASGAQIYIYNINGYAQIVNAAQHLATYGTVVASTSYSQGCNTYDAFAQEGDQIMNQLKVVLPVFSGGNNNGNSCNYGAGTQWGNITGGYKQGKNMMTVANLDAYEVIDNTSSHGPAEDGRIKPDISSNGKDQLSTDANNTTQVGGGTSAACPGMAGITAQLYQAYRELTGQANPEAALIKACLLNSAEDIGVVGPDYFFGYGRVNALRAVKTLEDLHYFGDSISNGVNNTHTIIVPPGTQRVRVMVLWNDVEGDPSAARALVNDLNITLTDPSSASFNPWVLNPAPNTTTLDDPAIRSIDSLNNMEQVTLDNPTAGTYTLTVEGHSIPFGEQKYYVVYQFDQDDIVVTYPNGGEGFAPGQTELLRWDAFGTTGNYSISYSTDSGAIWNSITTVAGNVRQYNWNVPSTAISANAMIRVTNGSVSGLNAHPFSIVGVPQGLNVDYSCQDSIKLSWNAVAGADSYEVSKLGSFYMDSIGTSTTNYAVLPNFNFNDSAWYSVKAVKGLNGKGRRALAIYYAGGLFNCATALDAKLIAQNPGNNGLAYACAPLNSYPVTIQVNNAGQPPINNFTVSYRLDGGVVVSEPISSVIPSGSSTVVSFATTVDISAPGNHNLKSWITYPADVNPSNDTLSNTFVTSPVSVAPITETFQASNFPPTNWKELQSNALYTWSRSTNIIGIGGTNTFAAWFDNFSYTGSIGAEDKLTTKLMDISGMTQPEFSFDLAYARFQAKNDELRVEISTDCGLTFMPTGYAKSGLNLATAGQSNTDWKPTLAAHWRKEVINLVPFLSAGTILMRFVNKTANGNNLYIDNVNVSDGPLRLNQLSANAFISVFPNPSEGIFTVNLNEMGGKQTTIEVIDAQGRIVNKSNFNISGKQHKVIVDLQNNPQGIYLLKVISGENNYFQKLLVN